MRHAAAIQTAPIKIVKDSGWGLALQDTTSLLLSQRWSVLLTFFKKGIVEGANYGAITLSGTSFGLHLVQQTRT